MNQERKKKKEDVSGSLVSPPQRPGKAAQPLANESRMRQREEMDGESVGDDEAEAAKLSWLPSLVCEKAACEHECVCV